MPAKSRWIFIDDQQDAAQSFANSLSQGHPIEVVVVSPTQAKEQLLTAKDAPDGVLMDIDLSNSAGEHGTGPGIAQDLRVKQRAHEIKEYPIVRFAGLEQVRRNIQGDPASEDLFDLKISKEKLQYGADYIVQQLLGAVEVYKELSYGGNSESSFLRLVGLREDEWSRFGHPAFAARLQYSMQIATHVAAGTFIRSFLCASGLLMDESMLAIRLGIDSVASAQQWQKLREAISFAYSGVGCKAFNRWWARGLDEWWHSTMLSDAPLSSLDINSRAEMLNERSGITGLVPLPMPQGSAGTKPWRFCSLSAEESPPRWVPIDPTESVRLTGSVDLPPWVDPAYAALGPALQARTDFRRNRSDLDRLSRKYGIASPN